MSELRLDLSVAQRRAVSFTADGRKAFVSGASVSVAGELIKPERLILDTGSEVDLIAPEDQVQHLIDATWAPRKLKGVTGHEVRVRVGNGDLLLGPHTQAVELWAHRQCSEWVVGLPVLRSFFLLLAAHETQLPTGPCLVHPRSALPSLPHP